MKNALCWLALCTLLFSAGARADHPLVSETADALPQGSCQVEFNRSNTKARSTPTEGSSDVQYSCGSGAQSQLAIGLTGSRADGLRSESYRAVGKTTLLAPVDGSIGLGLRYGASWSRGQGQGTELESTTVLAIATAEVSNGVLMHANLGFRRDRIQAQTTGLWSVGVETTDTVSVAVDVFGEERSKPAVSVGAGWRAAKSVFLSVAYAVQPADSNTKLKTLSIGLKLAF